MVRREKPYYSDYFFPVKTINGSWHSLYGHLLYMRAGERRQFMVVAFGRRLSFGFGERKGGARCRSTT